MESSRLPPAGAALVAAQQILALATFGMMRNVAGIMKDSVCCCSMLFRFHLFFYI